MDGAMLLERLRGAVDDHDLDTVVDCFTDDYRNETPAHPGRSFIGRDQVRSNWQRIFAGIPDVTATVVRSTVVDDVVWAEMELGGHRADGVSQLMRGVNMFGVEGDRFGWCRFYLEPVDAGEGGVAAAVGTIVGATDR